MDVLFKTGYSRSFEFKFEKRNIQTPIFFPSISTFGLKLPLDQITELISTYTPPQILVSCFDIHHFPSAFTFLKKHNKIVFFDSGLFESYWLNNMNWTLEKYDAVLSEFSPDIYTSFDFIPKIPVTSEDYYRETVELIDKSDKNYGPLFLPVLHPNESINIISLTSKIMENKKDEYIGISISEKDLGNDMISAIRNLKSIKKITSRYNDNLLIHMLGCGHPLNILIYSALGIDFFDSRSWTNSIINGNNLMLYPFSYLDGIYCDCDICKQVRLDYITKTLLHNIVMYENLTNSIKQWIRNNEIYEVIENYITNEKILKEIKRGI